MLNRFKFLSILCNCKFQLEELMIKKMLNELLELHLINKYNVEKQI